MTKLIFGISGGVLGIALLVSVLRVGKLSPSGGRFPPTYPISVILGFAPAVAFGYTAKSILMERNEKLKKATTSTTDNPNRA